MFVPQGDDDDLISVASSDLPPDAKTKGTEDNNATNKGGPKGRGKGKGTGKGKVQNEHEVVANEGVESAKDVSTTKADPPAPSKASGPSNSKGRKGKSKAVISDEDEELEVLVPEPEPEPSGRNKTGSKKSRIRSPQAGSKRRPSLVSPPISPTSKGRKRSRPQLLDSSANVGLAEAASHLHVNDPPPSVDTDVTMGYNTIDPILLNLRAPGGEDSPDEDAAKERLALRTPPPVTPRETDAISSPLTSIHSQSDAIEVDNTIYAMSHRPVPGTSRRVVQVVAPPPPLPLIDGLHGGSLAKNRDGSGNSKGKGRGKRRA